MGLIRKSGLLKDAPTRPEMPKISDEEALRLDTQGRLAAMRQKQEQYAVSERAAQAAQAFHADSLKGNDQRTIEILLADNDELRNTNADLNRRLEVLEKAVSNG
jgi:hypothetical protein